MLRRSLSLMLVFLLSPIAVAPVYGARDQKASASRVRQKISRLGVDSNAMVKLQDGRIIAGRIAGIDEDSFTLLTPVKGDRTGKQTDQMIITYLEVKDVKTYGSSGGANLGLGLVVFGAFFMLLRLLH